MTLQTSGAITLAQIQTEFGGSNPISMNEYYAGGTYVPSGTSGTNGAVPTSGQISFSQFYGTSDFLDSQGIVIGSYTDPGTTFPYQNILFNGYIDGTFGYPPAIGAISDGTSNIYGGAIIREISWFHNFTSNTYGVEFMVVGAQPNSGWTTMTIGTTSYSRASATYSSNPAQTYWFWSGTTTNPFPGITETVTFT